MSNSGMNVEDTNGKITIPKTNGKGAKDSGELSAEEIRKREHDALLQIIAMTSIVSTANKRGEVLTVNDKLCDVSQYTREECVGKPHNMFRHPDMPKEVFKEMWATIGRGKPFRGKIKNLKKDGTPYYVDAVVCPVLGDNGKPLKYLGVRYEITEQELERQNMLGMLGAIDSAYGHIEFDIEGNILSVNNNFLAIVGYQPGELEKSHHRVLVSTDYAKTKEYGEFWKDLAKGSVFNQEFSYLGKDGRDVWVRAVYAPVKDEMGRVVKIVGFATDITEQKSQATDLLMKVDRILDVVSAAEKGDLTQSINIEGEKPIDSVCKALDKFLSNLRENVTSISTTAESLTTSATSLGEIGDGIFNNAQSTSEQSNLVAAAAEEVSQNNQTVSAGAEELNASIKEIAKNAVSVASVASQAVTFTDEASETMVKLDESSTEIGKVVKVITSIAQQTNLLALNATIEAARAGEAGKGFAVVANEVKELAKETAMATDDISKKIETIQEDTQASVEGIKKISGIIKEINEIQNTIASAVEEQSATTTEIGRNVTDTAKGTREISENIMSVAKAAKETTEGAQSNQQAAKDLSDLAAKLKEVVSQFQY